MESEILHKIFIGKKDQNKVIVYESQLQPEIIDLLIAQLKDSGFIIPEYKEAKIEKRGSCYTLDIRAIDTGLDQVIIFYEYKFVSSI